MTFALLTSGDTKAKGAEVHLLPYPTDPKSLVLGLRRRQPGAAAAFHRVYVSRMSGMLYRILGPDPELSDVLHDCFVRALGAIEQLREPEALDSWIMGVTVMTAKTHLQRRVRRSWLRLWPTDEQPEAAFEEVEPEMREALRATYRILSQLSVDERIVFVLRYAEQLTVSAIAEQLALSTSTVKRRVARAEARFRALAHREPAVQSWIESWQLDADDAPSGARATDLLDEKRGNP